MSQSVETIAVDVLRCAMAWEPDAKLIGNVTARDVARLAVSAIDTCPSCGATAFVNIDCMLCNIAEAVEAVE